jgi:hypothetical protein
MPSGTTAEEIKMPEIADIMDVNIEDLSPEQWQWLQDAMDQFQQKCLLSFKKKQKWRPVHEERDAQGIATRGERRHDTAGERGVHAGIPGICGLHVEQAQQSFSWCIPANDGGYLWPGHGAGIQQGTRPRGHRGARRVKLSTTITEPADSASSS